MPTEAQFSTEADEADLSGYEASMDSGKHSIASLLMDEYFEQNGRRYHTYFGPDKNPMPSDAAEQERLNIFHEMLYLAAGAQINQAPVSGNSAIQNVLDLGTGTGIWGIDFAQENPHASVLGIDLTPIQPNWVPPNCRFEVDDFELDWTFKQKFDFINARAITQSVSSWPKLLQKIKSQLNPGGYVELSEGTFDLKSDDNTIPPDYPAARALKMTAEGIEKSGGLNPTKQKLRSMLEDAGFVNVQVKTFKVPVAPWAKNRALKQAGALYAASSKTGYEAYLLALGTRVLGYPEKEVLRLCEEAYQCHLTGKQRVHAYLEYHAAFAQKPMEE